VDKGLHPLDERYIDAYGMAGRETVLSGQPSSCPRCPLCLKTVVPTGHSRGGYRYFRHAAPEHEEQCPLTTPSYQLHGMSVRQARDPAVELRYRGRFLQQWQRHYRFAREATPWCSLPRFTRMIEYADVMNLWSYPALQLRDVPYVLLVMAGFINTRLPSGEAARERFWFDGSVTDVGDLWQHDRITPASLFRVVYRVPHQTPLPTAGAIMYWEPVGQAERLTEITVPRVPPSQQRMFARFLEHYEAQRRARMQNVPENEA
jgi:hypothetical protein